MATQNAIAIKRLEQEKSLKEQELALQARQLSETIANNLRVYDVNVDKNEIQRLANDQLNQRETNALIETMRNHLATELENNRSHMAQEDIQRAELAIKKMDVLLQAGKPTGKDAKAIMTSYFLQQANLQAFGGTSTPLKLIDQASTWLKDHDISIDSDVTRVPNGLEKPIINYQDDEGHLKGGIMKGKYFSKETGQFYNSKAEMKAAEQNEVPEDFSSSRGPGGKNNENSVKSQETTQTSGVGVTTPSKGPGVGLNSQQPTNGSGSKVIYSPGTKETEHKGPGYGMFQ